MGSLKKLHDKMELARLLSQKAIDPAIKKAGAEALSEENVHDAIFDVLEEQAVKIEELKKMLSN